MQFIKPCQINVTGAVINPGRYQMQHEEDWVYKTIIAAGGLLPGYGNLDIKYSSGFLYYYQTSYLWAHYSMTKQKAPNPSLTIRLTDSSMKVPSWWDSGNQTLRIINNGTILHKLNIGELYREKTMEDLQAWFASPQTSPPPFRRLFTTGVLSPGMGGWFNVNTDFLDFDFDPRLTSGNYIAYCDLPSTGSLKSHFGAGEFARFYVHSTGFR